MLMIYPSWFLPLELTLWKLTLWECTTTNSNYTWRLASRQTKSCIWLAKLYIIGVVLVYNYTNCVNSPEVWSSSTATGWTSWLPQSTPWRWLPCAPYLMHKRGDYTDYSHDDFLIFLYNTIMYLIQRNVNVLSVCGNCIPCFSPSWTKNNYTELKCSRHSYHAGMYPVHFCHWVQPSACIFLLSP